MLPSFIYSFSLSSGCPAQLDGVKCCFASSVRVLAPEKPQTVGLSQFCPHSSPRVSGDLLKASEFYVQSHDSPCQPRLHCPLLLGVMLAQDPDSDSIRPGHCAPPPKPAPVLICGLAAGAMDRAGAGRDWTDWTFTASQCRLLPFCIPFSQLEGALSKWTSYQDDVRQFSSWMDSVEAGLNESERQYAELREKTTALGKAKVGAGFQMPFVLWQASSECPGYVKVGLPGC